MVASISLPDLAFRPMSQHYTRADETHVRYRSESAETEVGIVVDGEGLVVDYPDTFHCEWPRA